MPASKCIVFATNKFIYYVLTYKTKIKLSCRLSLEQEAALFSRDAFGRQSMSEKRHASLDAKNTDTYQRNKKAR
jgi:hypothetical protein